MHRCLRSTNTPYRRRTHANQNSRSYKICTVREAMRPTSVPLRPGHRVIRYFSTSGEKRSSTRLRANPPLRCVFVTRIFYGFETRNSLMSRIFIGEAYVLRKDQQRYRVEQYAVNDTLACAVFSPVNR